MGEVWESLVWGRLGGGTWYCIFWWLMELGVPIFGWLYFGGIRSQNGETQLDVDVKIQAMPC